MKPYHEKLIEAVKLASRIERQTEAGWVRIQPTRLIEKLPSEIVNKICEAIKNQTFNIHINSSYMEIIGYRLYY